MKKSFGSRIALENLVVGEIYCVKVPALGEVFAKYLDKTNDLFEITAGMLKSQARNKTWRKGEEFTAPFGSDFYEVL